MNAELQVSSRPIRVGRKSTLTRAGILPLQSGQALVELALVVPMLLLLALGVIEIGRYAYIAILVGNAARAGAAYGAQSLPQAGESASIAAAAEYDFAGGSTTSDSSNGQNESLLTVTSAFTCGCDNGGTITPSPVGTNATCFVVDANKCTAGGHWVVVVTVTASGQFNALFNYPGIPSPINVSSTSFMRVANN